MRKLFLIIFFNLFICFNVIADEQTIWINPSETDYSRLSTGLAGSNISIIDEEEIEKSKNKTLPEIISNYSGVQLRSPCSFPRCRMYFNFY